jgi:hypothetical protein
MIRVALLAAAALAVLVAVHGLRRTDACDGATSHLVTAIATHAGGYPARAQAVRAGCDASKDLVAASIRLTAVGDRRDAITLARRATQTAPGDYLGWLGLARLLGPRDPERAVATAKVRELNPLASVR